MNDNVYNLFKCEKADDEDDISNLDASSLNLENICITKNNVIELDYIKKILEQKKQSKEDDRKKEIIESMRNHPSYKGEA